MRSITTNPLITADQTPDCPPHYWVLDSSDVGACRKCNLVKDFHKLLTQSDRSTSFADKARTGGQKAKGKPSKRKGRRKYYAGIRA